MLASAAAIYDALAALIVAAAQMQLLARCSCWHLRCAGWLLLTADSSALAGEWL